MDVGPESTGPGLAGMFSRADFPFLCIAEFGA